MIRYDKKFNSYLNRVVRNFNAKISRLQKQGYTHLPNKVSVRELKNSYDERRYLKTKLNELRRFSRRGAENLVKTNSGVIFNKWEIQNLQIQRRVQLARLTRQLKKYQKTRITNFGKLEIPTLSEYESDKYLSTKARYEAIKRRNLQDLSLSELERYKQLLQKRTSKRLNKQLKNNLIEALDKSGLFYGADDEEVDDIISKIESMSDDEVVNLFETDTSIKDIFNYYNIMQMKEGTAPSDVVNDVQNYFKMFKDNIDNIK